MKRIRLLDASLARNYASLALRAALGLTFLVSIFDRFGVLGAPGTLGVSWGTFAHFSAYVGMLNWYAPHALVPVIAWVDTALELVLAIALLLGLWLRPVSIISGLLLLAIGITMGVTSGIGAPFAYSVFTAAAAAFMLAASTLPDSRRGCARSRQPSPRAPWYA